MQINQLDDDCLLLIFRLLPIRDRFQLSFVCRRWYQMFKEYDFLAEQLCLALSKRCHCDRHQHRPHSEDLITFLFEQHSTTSHGSRLGRVLQPKHDFFYLNSGRFERLMSLAINLHSLVLSRCVSLDESLLSCIAHHCQHLQHLAFIDSPIVCSSLTWLDFSQQIGPRLTCLELLNCSRLTEHFISTLLRGSNHLINFGLSANDMPLQGLCLEFLPSTIQHLFLQDIEKFHAEGMTALLAIVVGHGMSLQSLKIKGRISLKLLRTICRQFRLRHLNVGDYFDTLAVRSSKEIGRQIAQIKTLESLQLTLPELLPFDHSLNEIVNAFTSNRKGQTTLTCLELIGASISCATFRRICASFPALKQFTLIYMNQFRGQFLSRPKNDALCHLNQLTCLQKLTLNGCDLQSQTVRSILNKLSDLQTIDLQQNPTIGPFSLNCLIDFANRVTHTVEAFLSDTGLKAWDVYPLTMHCYDGKLYVRPTDNLKVFLKRENSYTDSEEESENEFDTDEVET